MNKLEIRATGYFDKNEDSNIIRGLAIPVESRSELLFNENKYGYIYETITRSAVDENLIKNNDIKLYVNHDPSQGTLARSKYGEGSLKLFVTERGLEFQTELPNTEFGNEIREGIKRGDYDAISFAFYLYKEHYDDNPNPDGSWNRYIDSFALVDEISILSQLPAYSATNVDLRSLDDVKKKYQEKINADLDKKLNEIEELAKL
jgi:HK97 family phage prohead protease